jgi:hypothetical protein
MASDLYQSIGGNPQMQPQQQYQDPRTEALRRMQQLGFHTEGKENDPQALMQMVLQSSPIYQNRLPMVQNYLMQKMQNMGRR